MYAHNHSTLLGAKRRSIYYPPTGTGRDTYIMTDNGGTNTKYTCQGVPELGNFMKFGPLNRQYKPASNTKYQKYASDGTGRDKYVVSKHGGQFAQQDEMNLKLIKFRKTMRDGGEWRKEKFQQTETSWRSMSMLKKDDEMRRTQRSMTNRLSVPKRMTQKYQEKLNFLRFQYSNDSNKNNTRQEINNEEVQV